MLDQQNFTATTHGIKITAKPEAIERESAPDRSIFAFAYTITIENCSDSTVQLIDRRWIIKSSEIQIGEVVGNGVVGLQPTLRPGERFEYTSGSIIHDPIGSMEGTYTFRHDTGEQFLVQIPRFTLRFDSEMH